VTPLRPAKKLGCFDFSKINVEVVKVLAFIWDLDRLTAFSGDGSP